MKYSTNAFALVVSPGAFVAHSALAIPRLHLKHERGMGGTVKNDSSVGTARNALDVDGQRTPKSLAVVRALFTKGLARPANLMRNQTCLVC